MRTSIIVFSLSFLISACGMAKSTVTTDVNRSQLILDSIYLHYGVKNSFLLRETFPYNESYSATYLAGEEPQNQKNLYSYLWPFSGSLSAIASLYEVTGDKKFKKQWDKKVVPGLEEYYDTRRAPAAYASYIRSAPLSDRFYDDNVWIGIDFTDMFLHSGDKKYLAKAREIWRFIESGTDTILGGGIYWCEQKKRGKNTCSNAPGSVYALKLFEATGDSSYFYQGKELYNWTKTTLQDPVDKLYLDNIRIRDRRVDTRKFAYNSGQMMQAAALLYKITGDKSYLADAQEVAKSAHAFFFHPFTSPEGDSFRLINRGNIWFTAIMMRGYIELYKLDKDRTYVQDFKKSLDHAWVYMRDKDGLFGNDWSGEKKDDSKWLLTQFAMAEMYARISKID